MENIPENWKVVLQKAGVTNEQMKNNETAKFIIDFMKEQEDSKQKVDSVEAGDKIDTKNPSNREANIDTNTGPSLSGNPPPLPPKRTLDGLGEANEAVSPPPPPPLPSLRPAGNIVDKNLPRTDDERMEKNKGKKPTGPPRELLLSSIRSVGQSNLRKPEERKVKEKEASPEIDPSASSDILASMLSRALADRNKKMADDGDGVHNNDDDEW